MFEWDEDVVYDVQVHGITVMEPSIGCEPANIWAAATGINSHLVKIMGEWRYRSEPSQFSPLRSSLHASSEGATAK